MANEIVMLVLLNMQRSRRYWRFYIFVKSNLNRCIKYGLRGFSLPYKSCNSSLKGISYMAGPELDDEHFA